MVSLDRARSFVRPLSSTGQLLRKHFWIWPLIAAAILGGVGLVLHSTIEGVMRSRMAHELQTLLDADVEAVDLLLQAHQALALIAAHKPEIRSLARELASSKEVNPAALFRPDKLAKLHAELRPWIERYEYDGYAVFNRDGIIVAASREALLGKRFPGDDGDFVASALVGRATVSRPFPSIAMVTDLDGRERVGVPTMFVVAPIHGDDDHVVAALGFRMNPERTFTRILNVARPGASGETYAFDRSGRLLSLSRFDDELKRIGLIADQSHVRSILNLELRDPGVDMTTGARPSRPRSEQPLTRMAAAAVRGEPGIDVAGYRDYRGVPVVGAWKWLHEYGFGVATEVERAEAYRSLVILRRAFWALFAVLVAAAVAVFILMLALTRMRLRARRAVLEAKQLGQYTLEEQIGAGGMGVVYKARHALLRRPTAVKLLDVEKATETAVARFEREVQFTSRLNHPNTIAIYDYGCTPEGIFYYVMEYLDGLSLDVLVERFGPQPEGRVIHILHQVCGALAEAHEVGVIHRDIKPANIMINRRGGIADLVKVLDFGLVKAVASVRDASLTPAGSIVGSPRYLAPEQIERPDEVDARSDLYAVGSVGYFLVTGTPPIRGSGVAELLVKQVREVPEPPSARLGTEVSEDLEALILKCLSKRPEDRPESARALIGALQECRSAGTWTCADAEMWWRANAPREDETTLVLPKEPVVNKNVTVDLIRRSMFSDSDDQSTRANSQSPTAPAGGH
jgi:serine/threonine protein kinase